MMFPDIARLLDAPACDPTNAFDRFRSATQAGNEAYAIGDHRQALGHFEAALKAARLLFQQAVEGRTCAERAAAAVLVSRYNMAQNLSAMGHRDQAAGQLEAVCRSFSDWRYSSHAPEKLRQVCEWLLPYMLETCVAHLRRCHAANERVCALYEQTARQR